MLSDADTAADLADRREQRPEVGDRVVPARRIGDLVLPERVSDEHDSAGARDPQGVLDVVEHRARVRVDEHEVVCAVVHARQHVAARPAMSRTRAAGTPASTKLSPRVLLVVDLEVDRGERRIRRTVSSTRAARRRRRCRSRGSSCRAPQRRAPRAGRRPRARPARRRVRASAAGRSAMASDSTTKSSANFQLRSFSDTCAPNLSAPT